jgi:hypothetical protein
VEHTIVLFGISTQYVRNTPIKVNILEELFF